MLDQNTRGRGVEEQGTGVVGKEGFDWGMYALSSHSAHISRPHLRPRLPFLTFFYSDLSFLQSCSSSPFIFSPCPQQLGPFPPGS